MKKSYSSLNLLQQKLTGSSSSKGFLDYFFNNRKYLTLVFGYYDYLRGKVFIEDIFDMYDDVPNEFDLDVLIHLLYRDFMNQIKKGTDNKQIAGFLLAGKAQYLNVKKTEKRIMKALTEHVFSFESLEEEVIEEKSDEDKEAHLTIRMKEAEVLRGEIFLHDLSPFLKDVHLTIEDLLTILYLDFIKQIKEHGNSAKVQKNILFHLTHF